MEIANYIGATDQQLITLALEGDSTAFEHLFNRYRTSIYQLYMQRTGGNIDDTHDLLQETFIKVFIYLHKYNPDYTFGQWIYTIAHRTFIDYMRRMRDNLVSIDQAGNGSSANIPVSGLPTPEETMINTQLGTQLAACMERMSPKYRTLIELRFVREFSYEEIADKLSLPLGTVKTQIHRAREQLCSMLIHDPAHKK